MTAYVLLDGRAEDDPDDAIVYVYCDSLEEAIDYRNDFPDAVLAELRGTAELGRNVKMEVVPWPTK